MKKKLLMLFLGAFLLAVQVMAQQVTVTGKVTSSEDGQPIPGATVKVKGTSVATQANTSGVYSIKVNKGDVLQFAYLGMVTKEQAVGTAATINITLSPDTKALNEVVVTAFGIERSKRSLGYDSQTVKGEEIASTQRDNFINALQGRVAGVTVTPTNGVPGASSQIIIRGAVSLDGDNQPLFVVDGVPISNNTFSEYNLVGQGTYNRTNDYGNRGMDINPEEIESVTVLKGPEASALYGTLGASGAVVITTKRAKAGKATVSYNNSFRAETPYRFPDVQTVFGGGAGGIFDEEVRTRTFFGGRIPENRTRFDNLDAFYQTGFTQRHSASIEGGTEAISLRTSVQYTDQEGAIPGTAFNSLNFRVTGNAKISDKISANASVNYINNRTDKTYKGAGSPMISVLTWPHVDDIRNRYTATGERRTITGSYSAELDNPIWGMENNPNYDMTNRVMANFGMTYKPTNWLDIRGTAGTDVYSFRGASGYHPESYNANVSGTSSVGGGINTFNNNVRLLTANLVATAKQTYGKFKPVLRLGYDINDTRSETTSQFGARFLETNFFSLNNTDPSTQRVAYADVRTRKMGAFGQAELGYADLLYLTFTGRMDFSSTLPIANYNFFYPAASLSFVFSDLEPVKKVDWLSQGKLRASWGQSGKDARTAYITKTPMTAQTTTGGGFAVGVTLGNPDLKAEFTTSKEVGIDLGFFKDRLTANFTYYNVTSDGQITAPRLSYATGGILMYINSGLVSNNGIELVLRGTPIKKENFSWTIGTNITQVKGRIKQLPGEQETFYVSDSWLFGNVRRQYLKGSSVSAISSMEVLRNNAGEILINPANGMPIIASDWTQIGDSAPDFGIGLTNNFTYKNFDLSFLFDIRKGGDVYNATELYLYQRGMSTRSLDREVPRVIKGVLRDGLENTSNPTANNIVVIPSISTSYYSSFYNTSDFIEKDINWIRLKDITLSYKLPKSFLARTKIIRNASVFFTGTDLWLLTNYKGVDPSVNGLSAASGGTGGTGIDFGSYGLPRGYNFGIRVGF
ncbi:SusC/RagA family TonB-linked outer membrane protein [Pedobacter helvus]|uniref:SusC/RagA family TonB-linked outer membrane protein n=1 Tax=Pedobacter helvus TaxID=2563444 RepID=A0ABW9JHJ0_9SPHI|nr:SusC/RagA family TonB-linked outer membrane protein [Pedobacter ureilyticus]